MDPPAAIPPPATKADVDLSVEDASIALNSIATKYPSPQPSVLRYSKDPGQTPNTLVTDSEGHRPLSCDIHTTHETKPQALKSREYVQLVTLCWFIYLEGWNDGTSGPLLPRIQRVYEVGYAVVSLIFVSACLGFITGALSNVVLTEKLGFGKVMVMGSLFQVIAYSIECSAPPFPVFVFAYFINGIGLALQNAQSVGYVASFKENAETKMGILMAAYGAFLLTRFAQVADSYQVVAHFPPHL
ncbi:hypothetical protein J3R82DRAFT_3895 [Butyriboletus roseoflavus]|nr:hypothetical protein J3R82DRAFT_3895 [Butyriboletus roseoflavus]